MELGTRGGCETPLATTKLYEPGGGLDLGYDRPEIYGHIVRVAHRPQRDTSASLTVEQIETQDAPQEVLGTANGFPTPSVPL